ncbi:MAG: hypothetical protein ACLBM6_21800 [Cuspidothrix sp.]
MVFGAVKPLQNTVKSPNLCNPNAAFYKQTPCPPVPKPVLQVKF